jgi:hypothetical protein
LICFMISTDIMIWLTFLFSVWIWEEWNICFRHISLFLYFMINLFLFFNFLRFIQWCYFNINNIIFITFICIPTDISGQSFSILIYK